MNDPFILYAIARFADTSILLNLVRASRQFHALVSENVGVCYDLMDCYAVDGYVKSSDGTLIHHGRINAHASVQYWRAGQFHRDGDLPAIIWKDGIEEWYHNGVHHREGDLPAVITNQYRMWYKHGNLHRDGDKPAVIWMHWRNRNEISDAWWYKDGKIHRDSDQPAYTSSSGDSMWYKNGATHRDENRPAVIRSDGTRAWYTNGILCHDEIDEHDTTDQYQ